MPYNSSCALVQWLRSPPCKLHVWELLRAFTPTRTSQAILQRAQRFTA